MEVRKSGSLSLENYGPAIVHCSAGIGRSGTFCLVDSCLVMVSQLLFIFITLVTKIFAQAEKGSAKVDIQNVLLEMRKYRPGLIQTRDQLRFAYRAIIQGAKDIFNLSNNDEDNDVTHPSKKVKTDEPNGGSQPSPPSESVTPSNNNLTSATELRQRLREEKKRKMTEKIKNIKEKQKDSESRLRTKNFLIKVGIFSLGLIATASLVYYFWPSSISAPDKVESHFQDNIVHLMSDNDSLPDHSTPRVAGS